MMTPPIARVEVVRDTYFGTTIEDPYRWMEAWQSPEARAWLDAQGAHTRAYLDALPQRAALLERIAELGNVSSEVYYLQVAGGRAFYLRRDPDVDLPRLVVRITPDAPEQVLFDPSAVAGETHTAIDWYVPSRDGRLVAYGISLGGSENSTLHVVDVDSGQMLDNHISRVHFPFVSWLEDNRSFVYHRYPD
ncbi:MAG TPA: hypothetical protein VLA19_02755, partial [Herpetosiphonaceae bacterium]|nr:hypothetical protein [Herpetosiphonaceae bacterium]